MLMAQNRNNKFFLGGKTTDMEEKKLKTLLCMVYSVNKKFLFFCLQFSFKPNSRKLKVEESPAVRIRNVMFYSC